MEARRRAERVQGRGEAKTIRITIFDLTQAAIREYPNSEFAVMHRGPMN